MLREQPDGFGLRAVRGPDRTPCCLFRHSSGSSRQNSLVESESSFDTTELSFYIADIEVPLSRFEMWLLCERFVKPHVATKTNTQALPYKHKLVRTRKLTLLLLR